MRTFCLLWVSLALLTGCPHSMPGPDGGGGGAGGGGSENDAGQDSGVPNDDLCDFGGPRTCPTGQSCTLSVLLDGGQAKRCVAGACDLVAQDCDAGLKCAFLDGGRTCLPDGTLDEGASCAGATVGCRRGLACTFVGTDGGSACARFCRVNGDCTSPQECYVTLILPDTNERPLVCAAPPMMCDPLLQDCVATTEACYPGVTGSACFPFGTVDVGQACTFSNDCKRGSACSGGAGGTVCRQICGFPSAAPTCDAGTCTRLTTSMTVGVCLP